MWRLGRDGLGWANPFSLDTQPAGQQGSSKSEAGRGSTAEVETAGAVQPAGEFSHMKRKISEPGERSCRTATLVISAGPVECTLVGNGKVTKLLLLWPAAEISALLSVPPINLPVWAHLFWELLNDVYVCHHSLLGSADVGNNSSCPASQFGATHARCHQSTTQKWGHLACYIGSIVPVWRPACLGTQGAVSGRLGYSSISWEAP